MFVGTVLAGASITANSTATVSGRLLAGTGQVELHNNVVTRPAGCGPQDDDTNGDGEVDDTEEAAAAAAAQAAAAAAAQAAAAAVAAAAQAAAQAAADAAAAQAAIDAAAAAARTITLSPANRDGLAYTGDGLAASGSEPPRVVGLAVALTLLGIPLVLLRRRAAVARPR